MKRRLAVFGVLALGIGYWMRPFGDVEDRGINAKAKLNEMSFESSHSSGSPERELRLNAFSNNGENYTNKDKQGFSNINLYITMKGDAMMLERYKGLVDSAPEMRPFMAYLAEKFVRDNYDVEWARLDLERLANERTRMEVMIRHTGLIGPNQFW